MNNYAHYHNRSKVLIKQSGKTVLKRIAAGQAPNKNDGSKETEGTKGIRRLILQQY